MNIFLGDKILLDRNGGRDTSAEVSSGYLEETDETCGSLIPERSIQLVFSYI
jgi:hypothetical protein